MSDQTQRREVRRAVDNVSQLAKVFYFATTFGIAIVAARAFGIDHVGPLGIEAPLSSVWVIFLGITVAHCFLSITAVNNFSEVVDPFDNYDLGREPVEPVSGEELYQEIRSQNTVFLRGLQAREPTARGRLYRMSWRDPTTLVFVGLCLLDYIAILPWKEVDGRLEWTAEPRNVVALVTMGILLLVLNWVAGGKWTIALSQLRLQPEEQTDLHHDLHTSGPAGNEPGCLVLLIIAVLALTAIPWLLVTLL